MKITDFLLEGKSNAISMRELAKVTGLSERAVRNEILNARLHGKLIVSDENGYYLPEAKSDIKNFVAVRKQAIKTSQDALQPFVDALR